MKISTLFGIYFTLTLPSVIFLYYYPIINAWINSIIAIVISQRALTITARQNDINTIFTQMI
ncbi:MAG: hypothetical protein HRT93_02155 [Piscirickettsiaceae bacterium]|nr:hypothetical protein [Piscirickettsiaceae bacterium]